MENHPATVDADLAQAGALTDRDKLAEAEAVLQRSEQMFADNKVAVVYQVLVRVERAESRPGAAASMRHWR